MSAVIEQPLEPKARIDETWDFDPDVHSAASHIEGIADYIREKAADDPFFSRASGAFKWLNHTVGVDIVAVEKNWREFPIIVVPQQVSDSHGLQDPQSLFAYLANIRLSYVAGAFLAAISMCRAATEVMIRDHYNTNDHNTKLTRLIEKTQARRKYSFIKNFNLVAKVNDANEILHFNRDDIRNVDRTRALIRDWIKALQDLIAKAPPIQQIRQLR